MPWIEANAIVANKIDVLLFVTDCANFDHWVFALRAELKRVRQEIRPYLFEQDTVPHSFWQRPQSELRLRTVVLLLQSLKGGSCKCPHILLHLLDRLASEPRKREKLVDEHPHAVCFALDNSELAPRLLVELTRVVVPQHFGETRYGAHRRAKVVGNRITKALQLLVG